MYASLGPRSVWCERLVIGLFGITEVHSGTTDALVRNVHRIDAASGQRHWGQSSTQWVGFQETIKAWLKLENSESSIQLSASLHDFVECSILYEWKCLAMLCLFALAFPHNNVLGPWFLEKS